MKISKRVREQAALICAIAACELPEEPQWQIRGDKALYTNIERWLDADVDATRLALAAWREVGPRRVWTQAVDAEAESLLRTGWSP